MSFIAVIDYKMGNLLSVSKALEASGAQVKIVTSPAEASDASGLVLPGVGNLSFSIISASLFITQCFINVPPTSITRYITSPPYLTLFKLKNSSLKCIYSICQTISNIHSKTTIFMLAYFFVINNYFCSTTICYT